MNRLTAKLNRLEGCSWLDIAGESLLRTRRRISRALARARDKRSSAWPNDHEISRAVSPGSLKNAIASFRTRKTHRLTPGLADLNQTSALVQRLFPRSSSKAALIADQIVARRICVFSRAFQFDAEIDWHRDPVSSFHWPADHYTRIQLSPGRGADPRQVWELNRLYHLVALGRAYALTRDDRYTTSFIAQLVSWYEQNPPRFGINWTIGMEAGIRTVNILAAFEFFRTSGELSDDAASLVLKILFAHGRFIRANLERSRLGSSNHYLSNLIGLLAIGCAVPELRDADSWRRFAARELNREITRQIREDGVDHENSIAYHRLVLEIFALGFLLQKSAGINPPLEYVRRLRSMFEFNSHYLKPDGTAPMMGDSDDGRLLKFLERDPRDHSYLCSIGSAVLEESEMKRAQKPDEEMLWWLGAEGLRTYESLTAGAMRLESKAFAVSQFYIQRAGDLYAAIDCSDHGLRGRGSHAHSDALSFELYANGRTFLRDPGTYTYSGSEARRNLFRSTAYHNTVRVDRQEISEILAGQLFSLGQNVKPHVNSWTSTEDFDVLDAEHHGYLRLASPVVHRRLVTLFKKDRAWVIRDVFTGEGEHLFEFFFNFDAGLRVSLAEDGRADAASEARTAGGCIAVIPMSGKGFQARVRPRWISPSYGTRLRSSAIIYRLQAEVPLTTEFLFVPYDSGNEARVLQVVETFHSGTALRIERDAR